MWKLLLSRLGLFRELFSNNGGASREASNRDDSSRSSDAFSEASASTLQAPSHRKPTIPRPHNRKSATHVSVKEPDKSELERDPSRRRSMPTVVEPEGMALRKRKK